MTISQDLRLRVVDKVKNGTSRRQAAVHYGISASSAVRFVQKFDKGKTVALKVRGPHKRRLDAYGEDLLSWIEQTPDLTLAELSERLQEVHGVQAPKWM